MTGISILIQAFNEEKNIRHALESCMWADEVIVIDNYSTDDAARIVGEFPNARVIQRHFEGYAAQKNWALSNLQFFGDWIFILDADERITPDLRAEIQRIVNSPSAAGCWYVNRRFYFLGRWIRHCGWYPSWSLRFFKKGCARYEERGVDEHMIPSGPIAYLKNDLIHEDHKDLEAWIAKHNRYSTLEAHEQCARTDGVRSSLLSRNPVERKRALKQIFYSIPGRPFLRFFIMYIVQLGFLDGYPGFVFCILRGIQEFHISIKIRELNQKVRNKKNEV